MLTTFADIRYACRSLARSPAFAVILIATLTLGIGANLTMFSLMRGVLWRPLPYPEPDRIVTIRVDARNVANAGATRRELLSLGDRSRSFEAVATMNELDAEFDYAGRSEHVAAANISDGFIAALGVRPAFGRTLVARIDASEQQPLAAMISDSLWRSKFGADPGVIGKSVRVNDQAVRIAGVLPSGFRLFLPPSVSDLEQVDIWLPYRVDPAIPYRGVPVIARLRRGVTLDAANAELQTLAAQFERDYPDFYGGPHGWQASPSDRGLAAKVHFTARLLQEDITREARPLLFLLSASVLFVLLTACVNVANLLLARGSARQRELDTRRALGAPRLRIIQQLLAESLVLAMISGALGLLSTHFALQAITHQNVWRLPLETRIGIDGTVMLFAFLLSLVTCILCGLIPAWRVTADKARQVRTGRRTQRILAVTEVALSIVPLVCGGLMLRSFLNLLHTPLGFDPVNVVTATVPIDSKRYPTIEQRWAFLRGLLANARATPGVESASAVNHLPLSGQESRRVGRKDKPDSPPILASQLFALPGYLHAIRTPLLEGRDFADEDIALDRPTAIIDHDLATRLWPEGAIGKRLVIYRTGRRDEVEVIGVAGSARLTRVRDDNTPLFILPYGTYPENMSLVIRTRNGGEHFGPIRNTHPMSDYVADSLGDTRFMVFVLTVFAAASVLLTAIGLYGTLTYLTLQRTREFGIRLALGSSFRGIVGIVVGESGFLTLAGTAIGLVGAFAVARTMRAMLYGVEPLDSVTSLCVVALIALISLSSATVPALRAARTDPQASLRSE